MTFSISMYILCVCLFRAFSRRVGALQISIIIIIITMQHWKWWRRQRELPEYSDEVSSAQTTFASPGDGLTSCNYHINRIQLNWDFWGFFFFKENFEFIIFNVAEESGESWNEWGGVCVCVGGWWGGRSTQREETDRQTKTDTKIDRDGQRERQTDRQTARLNFSTQG